jgi:uncharacterized protein (TIGR01615 family)
MEESVGSPAPDCSESKALVHEVKRLTRPASQAEHRLSSDVHGGLAGAPCADQLDHGARVASLAQRLTALGYQVAIRTALGGGDGSECLHNLGHSFITVDLQQQQQQQEEEQQEQREQEQQQRRRHAAAAAAGHAPPRHVIDPHFQAQFIVAAPSARYRQVLDAVPEVFVGPEPQLLALVDLLCREMAASFKQLQVVMPPWRQPASILSKWQPSPRRSVDSPVRQADASPWRPQQAPQQQRPHRLGGQAAMLRAAQQLGAGVSRHGSPAAGFEPLRIVVGGNFLPVPAPAPLRP